MRSWLWTFFALLPLVNSLTSFSGTLLQRHIEYPHGVDEDRYYLQETEQRLLFNETLQVSSGQRINGMGTLFANQSIAVESFSLEEPAQAYSYDQAMPSSTEQLRIIMFIVNLCDQRVTNTTTFYNTILFPSQRYNMADYYTSCSLGKYSVSRNSTVFSPVTYPCANFNNTCEDIDFTGWAVYAENAAKARGVNLSAYKYRVFIIPYSTTCGWLGLADVGCVGWCRAWVKGGAESLNLVALFHELGHNHGLRHAATPDSEYGDYTSAMGACCEMRCHNAPQAYSLGWYTALPFKTQSGFAEIPALLTNPVNYIQLGSYYISFRGKQGYDVLLSASNQIHIHNYSGTLTNRYSRSVLLAALKINDTYSPADEDWSVYFVNYTATKALIYVTFMSKLSCGKCGDGVCDPSAGETCYNCPKDCRERSNNNGVYFCCGETHLCDYARCNTTKYPCRYNCGGIPLEDKRKIILR